MFEKSKLLLEDDLKQDLIDLELLREAEQLREYYHFLQRTYEQPVTPLTFILVSIHSIDGLVQQHGVDLMKDGLMVIHKYLAQEKGESNLLIRMPTQHIWALLMKQSTMEEAIVFLEKVFQNTPSITDERGGIIRLQLSGCIMEAGFEDMDKVYEAGKKHLEEAMKSGPSQIKILNHSVLT